MRMSCLFVEHLTVIDCAYLDAQRGLVGESWIVDVELEGELDDQSMVLDFGEVKRRLKRAIDSGPDHTLLVPLAAPQLQWNRRGDEVSLAFDSAAGRIEHRSPAVALSLIDADHISAGGLAHHLHDTLKRLVPTSVASLRLELRQELIPGAHYHYVHGLKKHQGQCQRIAHGHRSKLEVRLDGQRVPDLEQALAQRWRDIYLGTREDVASREQDRLRFRYRAPEGEFELCLPESRCDLLRTDTTVECIAAELAQRTAAAHAGRQISVRAYEGVMKGARAQWSA
jgi:6-pyruvoyl-tetrahydropterin synthase